jgi:hypothetical protein
MTTGAYGTKTTFYGTRIKAYGMTTGAYGTKTTPYGTGIKAYGSDLYFMN